MNYKENPFAVRLYNFLSIAKLPYNHSIDLVTDNDLIVVRFYKNIENVFYLINGATHKKSKVLEEAFEDAYNEGILEPLCPKDWNPYIADTGCIFCHNTLSSSVDWMDVAESYFEIHETYKDEYWELEDMYPDAPDSINQFLSAFVFLHDSRWYAQIMLYHSGGYFFGRVDEFNLFFALPEGIDKSLEPIVVHKTYLKDAVKSQYQFLELFLENRIKVKNAKNI